MGKGDKRSRRGKIWKGSYGNTRRRKEVKKPVFVPKPKTKKTAAPQLEIALAEAPMVETPAEVTAPEVKAAKPKKAAVKKPKAEGEQKAVTKKAPKKKEAPKEAEQPSPEKEQE